MSDLKVTVLSLGDTYVGKKHRALFKNQNRFCHEGAELIPRGKVTKVA